MAHIEADNEERHAKQHSGKNDSENVVVKDGVVSGLPCQICETHKDGKANFKVPFENKANQGAPEEYLALIFVDGHRTLELAFKAEANGVYHALDQVNVDEDEE